MMNKPYFINNIYIPVQHDATHYKFSLKKLIKHIYTNVTHNMPQTPKQNCLKIAHNVAHQRSVNSFCYFYYWFFQSGL